LADTGPLTSQQPGTRSLRATSLASRRLASTSVNPAPSGPSTTCTGISCPLRQRRQHLTLLRLLTPHALVLLHLLQPLLLRLLLACRLLHQLLPLRPGGLLHLPLLPTLLSTTCCDSDCLRLLHCCGKAALAARAGILLHRLSALQVQLALAVVHQLVRVHCNVCTTAVSHVQSE
jgi:hypothetical protein